MPTESTKPSTTTQETRELEPCPFCGSRARLTVIAEHLAPAQNGFPVLLECGGTASCFSQYFVNESAAITFWNTRAPSDVNVGHEDPMLLKKIARAALQPKAETELEQEKQ